MLRKKEDEGQARPHVLFEASRRPAPPVASDTSCQALHTFITAHREEIVGLCLIKVTARQRLRPRRPADQCGVPVFLDQLVSVMRLGLDASATVTRTALLHGQELHAQGLAVSDVVHNYGDVCQSVTELAIKGRRSDQPGRLSRTESLSR